MTTPQSVPTPSFLLFGKVKVTLLIPMYKELKTKIQSSHCFATFVFMLFPLGPGIKKR